MVPEARGRGRQGAGRLRGLRRPGCRGEEEATRKITRRSGEGGCGRASEPLQQRIGGVVGYDAAAGVRLESDGEMGGGGGLRRQNESSEEGRRECDTNNDHLKGASVAATRVLARTVSSMQVRETVPETVCCTAVLHTFCAETYYR